MRDRCYCKKCKKNKFILNVTIDEKDREVAHLECGHKRVFQLITSEKDYLEV